METTLRILKLVQEGYRPPEIARDCKLSLEAVISEIQGLLEKRSLKRSTVLGNIDEKWLEQIAKWEWAWRKSPLNMLQLLQALFDGCDISVQEVELYLYCLQKGFRDGELYEAVCAIERTLHGQIELILQEKYGKAWWRKVPLKIRKECVTRVEENDEEYGSNPYNCTTLIHLKEIIEENKKDFEERLPIGVVGTQKQIKQFSGELQKLNKIRNRVMHPIGAKPLTEEEFFFVRELKAKLDLKQWR